MDKIQNLPLNAATFEAWKHLALPKWRPILENKPPDVLDEAQLIALGIEKDNTPQALLLGSVIPDLGTAEIHSLTAEDPDLLRPLLLAFEERLKKDTPITCTFSLPDTGAESLPLFHLLESLKWHGPKSFLEKYLFDIYNFHPPWFDTTPPLSKHYQAFPWSDLKHSEKEELLRQIEEGRIPQSVSPFGHSEPLHSSSLGIRHGQELVGFCVTHLIPPDFVRFTALYIHKEKQHLGPIIRLLIDSIKIQQRVGPRYTLFEVNLKNSSPSWEKFIKVRLFPYSIGKISWVDFWKTIPSVAKN